MKINKERLELLKSRIDKLKCSLIIRGEKTSGVIESLLSAMIFYSPNFLFLLPSFKNWLFIFLIYNYVIIFILVSTITHLKFNTNKSKQTLK